MDRVDSMKPTNQSQKNESAGGGDKRSEAAKSGLSQNDKPDPLPPVNTRVEIAKAAGVSTGQVGMADLIAIGESKRSKTLKQNTTVLSQNDTTDATSPVSTRIEIAKAAGVSTGQQGGFVGDWQGKSTHPDRQQKQDDFVTK